MSMKLAHSRPIIPCELAPENQLTSSSVQPVLVQIVCGFLFPIMGAAFLKVFIAFVKKSKGRICSVFPSQKWKKLPNGIPWASIHTEFAEFTRTRNPMDNNSSISIHGCRPVSMGLSKDGMIYVLLSI